MDFQDHINAADAEYVERRLLPAIELLARYHRFETRGMERIPRAGRLLIVSTHSAITYELLLGMCAIYESTHRVVRALGDHFWFRVPYVGSFLSKVGVVPGDPRLARYLLERDEVVGVGPGGMWEALKPSRERFQIRWGGRRGFARLALETNTPIILAACPAADLALTVYASRMTDLVYKRFRLPLPLMRGLGPTLMPRPVKLTAHFSELLPVSAELNAGTPPTEEEVTALADSVALRMRRLIDDAVREDGL